MKNVRPIATVSFLGFFAACSLDSGALDGSESALAGDTGSVAGTVTLLGAPKAGVTVTLRGHHRRVTTTAVDGSFAFATVPAGTYELDFESGAISNQLSAVTVSAAGTSVPGAAGDVAFTSYDLVQGDLQGTPTQFSSA